jgi:hypothetical protein
MNLKSFIPALLLFASVNACAQKWSAEVDAGAVVNSKLQSLFLTKSGVIGPTATIGVNYSVNKKWQVGLALDYQRFSTRIDAYLDIIDPLTGAVKTEHIKTTNYKPSFSLIAKANRTFTINRFQYYAGLSAGIYALSEYVNKDNKDNLVLGGTISYYGFRAGLQLGTNYALSQHWALNAVLSGNCFVIPQHYKINNDAFVSGTLSFGVIYKF